MGKCTECDGTKRVCCDECDGSGVVVCDYEHEHDCPDCDGDGEWDCETCVGAANGLMPMNPQTYKTNVVVHGITLNPVLLRAVVETAPDDVVELEQFYTINNSPLALRCPGWIGAVMPRNEPVAADTPVFP